MLNSNGDSITSNDDTCGNAAKITYTLSAGTYYVQVSGYSSNYGSYTLSYRRTPLGTITTCNSRSTSTDTATISPTTNWQTVSGSLSSGADTKRYKVTVSTSGQHEFSLCSGDGGSCNYDSWLCLLNSNGDSITSNDDTCGNAAKITYTLSAGTYYVQVSGYSSNYGSYTLSYRRCPAFSDEFNSLDTNRWIKEIDQSTEDIKVESGKLKLFLYNGHISSNNIVNGGVRIYSPPNKNDIYKYGKYEAKFKSAIGKPEEKLINALYTYPYQYIQGSGEIDIELYGHKHDIVSMAIHRNIYGTDYIVRELNLSSGTSINCILTPENYVACTDNERVFPCKDMDPCRINQLPSNLKIIPFSISDDHTYRFEWYSDHIKFYIDNYLSWDMNNLSRVPSQPANYIISVGQQGGGTTLNHNVSMEVDYAKYECT